MAFFCIFNQLRDISVFCSLFCFHSLFSLFCQARMPYCGRATSNLSFCSQEERKCNVRLLHRTAALSDLDSTQLFCRILSLRSVTGACACTGRTHKLEKNFLTTKAPYQTNLSLDIIYCRAAECLKPRNELTLALT